MTPRSILTGRNLDSRVSAISVNAGATTSIGDGDANRVGLVVAIGAGLVAAIDGTIVVLGGQAGSAAPLTVLTSGHPVCYLSVDKIGSALFGPLSVQNNCTGAIPLGITMVRHPQPLEE